jgi:hypothetical protein
MELIIENLKNEISSLKDKLIGAQDQLLSTKEELLASVKSLNDHIIRVKLLEKDLEDRKRLSSSS